MKIDYKKITEELIPIFEEAGQMSIDLYNKGINFRDFTFVDDIAEAISKLINKEPRNNVPYDVFNIGRGKTIQVNKLIKVLTLIIFN